MARRSISWSTAMRGLTRDRVPGSCNAMYEASLARARDADARREAHKAAKKRQENIGPFGRCDAVSAFLGAARHNRLSAQCDPDGRETYLSRARHWLAEAAKTRRTEGSRLP